MVLTETRSSEYHNNGDGDDDDNINSIDDVNERVSGARSRTLMRDHGERIGHIPSSAPVITALWVHLLWQNRNKNLETAFSELRRHITPWTRSRQFVVYDPQ